MIGDYLNQSAYLVTEANHVLYTGLSVASPTLTSLPAVAFRCKVTVASTTGHTDVAGSVVVGSETLTFTAAGKKTTTVSLSALPVVSCSGLDCSLLIEAISTAGAPLQAETLTAIKIRKEAYQSGFYNGQGVWTVTRDMIECETLASIGDKIRYAGVDYTVQKVEDHPDLGGENEYYIFLVT